jgi:hypothetical protein
MENSLNCCVASEPEASEPEASEPEASEPEASERRNVCREGVLK